MAGNPYGTATFFLHFNFSINHATHMYRPMAQKLGPPVRGPALQSRADALRCKFLVLAGARRGSAVSSGSGGQVCFGRGSRGSRNSECGAWGGSGPWFRVATDRARA